MCGLVTLVPSWGTASKTISYINDLWIKTSDYKLGETFSLYEVDGIDCIDDLADCVQSISDSDAALVRGTLTDHGRAMAEAGKLGNRRMDSDLPCLMETLRQWAMLDIDGWRLPAGYNLYDIEDHEAIVDAMIRGILLPEFHDVRCFYQFSASCGTAAAPDILKIHLFFWLARPHSNADLRAIFKMHMPDVDRKVFTGNQPHFVANPILNGRCDPLPARFGWHDGTLDEVDLPVPPPTPVYIPASGPAGAGGQNDANWLESKLSTMGDGPGLDGFYEVIRGVIWDYAFRVVRGGVARNDHALIDIILYSVRVAPKASARGLTTLNDTYLNREWMQSLIEAAIAKRIATKPEAQEAKVERLLRERLIELKGGRKHV